MSAERKTKPIGITEMVLRDGHQSLIATRMQLEDMLPICQSLDKVGFWALEVWGGATFDSCVRFLREDPWERLRLLRKSLPNTRLSMLLRGQNLLGYRHYSDEVVRLFVAKASDNGMDVFRIFDALNDLRNMDVAIQAVKSVGKHAQGAISYTTSPVHTIDAFVDLAARLVDAGCESVAIKDMAGIMTPSACGELVAAIKDKVAVPIHVHSHYTSGLAAMCQMRAVEAGADVIDTVVSPFAGGASHPPTETMIYSLRGTPHDTGIDINLVSEIAEYFRRVRPKYWQYESEFTGTDPKVVDHHVPGGMISNLANQLKEQNAIDKMDAVLDEIPRVRKDLGYPPLVTPASQIVGTQAVLNVITGKRYGTVTKEVKNYLCGHYGLAPSPPDPEVRKLAVGDAEMMTNRPADSLPDGEIERLKGEIGSLALSEEDVLTYAMFPDVAKVYLQERAAGQLKPEVILPKPEHVENSDASRTAAKEFKVTVHGETYHVLLTGLGHNDSEQRPLYLTIDGVPEEALVETLDEFQVSGALSGKQSTGKAAKRPKATEPGHVTTTMPGTVVSVLVESGQEVSQGDPVLVLEAMKMESEIQAPIDGRIVGVLIEKGEAVHPGEILMKIGK